MKKLSRHHFSVRQGVFKSNQAAHGFRFRGVALSFLKLYFKPVCEPFQSFTGEKSRHGQIQTGRPEFRINLLVNPTLLNVFLMKMFAFDFAFYIIRPGFQ